MGQRGEKIKESERQRERAKKRGGSEVNAERGENEWILFDSGGLNVWLSPVVRGSFRGADWQTAETSTSLSLPSLRPPMPPSPPPLPLYLSIFLSTTVQQPLILLPHINQCRQQREERGEGWLVFQCFRCCLCHVRQRSDALFIYALIYVFIRQRRSPLCAPISSFSAPSEA